MEKTFESEATRIHEAFQKQRKLIEMNLSINYNPKHDIRNKMLAIICGWILRLAGSDFRIKFINHEGE
jgi:hypothetical protein